MRRELKKILRANRDALVASQMTLGDIFTIMFRCRDNVLWEQNDGFRITKQTYGEVHDRICRAAGALYARLGATHRYVALELENGPDWIVAFWAILMSGNKPYLVNMRYPQALSQGILNTLGIRHVVCQGGSQLEAEVIAVGDNLNAMAMSEAFNSYAMAHGHEGLKDKATHVTENVTDMILRELGDAQ